VVDVENSIGKKVFFVLLVVLVPLAAALYMIFAGMTVVFVENEGAQDVALTVVSRSGNLVETSEARIAQAGRFAYIILSPRIPGEAALQCSSPVAAAGFAIGPITPDGFTAARLRIDGCGRLRERKSVAI
jgi:hypothetical protein